MEVTVLFMFGRGEAGKGKNSEASFPKASYDLWPLLSFLTS